MRKIGYAYEHDSVVFMGNDSLECQIQIGDSAHLEALTNKLTGRTFEFSEARECVLRIASSTFRIDIREWRFHPGSGDAVAPEEDLGFRAGFYRTEVDETHWTHVQLLNEFPLGTVGYSTIIYPGYGWYRHSFTLPREAEGFPIEFGLGGCDNQDWLEYRVYVNGTLVGHAIPKGYWHPAPCYVLNPGDERYRALRFGAPNVLAIQTRGLDRRFPGMSVPDAERYSIGSILVDQYVSVGPCCREVTAFGLLDRTITTESGRSLVELRLINESEGLGLNVRYWIEATEAVIHKQIIVTNMGNSEHVLLEIDLQQLTGDFTASGGGVGYPCRMEDEVFCGIRHPAGVSEGDVHSIRLTMFPGVALAPGGTYESKVVVFGVGAAGEAGQAFVGYIERHGHRRRELLHMYHCYGIHDLAGTEEPTSLTEEMVLNNLGHLEEFQKRGIVFDYYFIDAGWSNPHGDLKDFDPRNFPEGPEQVKRRINELGMKFGLWTSPAAGPGAFHPNVKNPALAPCGTLPSLGHTDGPRGVLCMAAEPWRSMYREALLYHARRNGVRGFKLDGSAFCCTNPEHGHLPGKYSVEAIMDATIDTLEAVRRECPDIVYMYYWNMRSPWWLLYGDTLYERGILMEGATPSDFPTRLLRQSVTISFDQTTHHAWDRVPLCSGDSLGVWISKTRWGSYMGAEGWQDAWIMDIARGSMLCQLWGDLSMFGADDVAFLSEISAWLRDYSHLLRHPRRILGDPWKAEPYGYAYFEGDDGVLFIYNPQFTVQTVSLQLGPDFGFAPDRNDQLYGFRCIYPRGQAFSLLGRCLLSPGDRFQIHLQPFEVKMLQVFLAAGNEVEAFPASVQEREKSLELPCRFEETLWEELRWDNPENEFIIRRVVNGRAQYVDTAEGFQAADIWSDERDRNVTRRVLAGTLSLPPTSEKASLPVIVRISREGIWWHHHCLCDIIRLKATMRGEELPVTSTPQRWHEQAGGWSWILFDLPVRSDVNAREVCLEIETYLPKRVDIEFRTWLFRDL